MIYIKRYFREIICRLLKRFNIYTIPKHIYEEWKFKLKEYGKLETIYTDIDEGLHYLNRGRDDAYRRCILDVKKFNDIEE